MHDIYKRGRRGACNSINLSYCIFSCVYHIKVIIKIKELLNMLLKQLFCKHEWDKEAFQRVSFRDKYQVCLYVCDKCGKSHWFADSLRERIWRRKREFKGDTFID